MRMAVRHDGADLLRGPRQRHDSPAPIHLGPVDRVLAQVPILGLRQDDIRAAAAAAGAVITVK
jgi:hypothetical protein